MAKVAKVKKEGSKVSNGNLGGLTFKLSPAREAELVRKIEEASAYYEKTFSVKLSPQDVFDILQKVVERDKERLFINKIGNVSEADILWYAAKTGLIEGVSDGNEQGKEGGVEEVSGAPEGDPFKD